MRILFVSWDGPQVSYIESLFLPIFAGLGAEGVSFDILQFRWGDAVSQERVGQACRSAGIGYRAVPIWRWGGGAGPFLCALAGARHVRRAVREFNSDLIMPRSLMPALAVLRAGGKRLRPTLFDADGLAADERVDVAGLSPESATYRILRDVEAQMIRHSAAVTTRTSRAAEILYHRAGPPVSLNRFHVVTNGRDEAVFQIFDHDARASVRRELGIDPGSPLLAYAGSVGPQYRLDAMLSLFNEVRRLRADARFLLMTGSPERAMEAAKQPGVVVLRVAPDQVPRHLAAADAGLAYRADSFSMQGVAPVKLSEYLLCGLPVIGTRAIGDTGPAVREGLFLDDENGSAAAARWFVEEVLPRREEYRQKARTIGREHFSLRRSIQDYTAALRHVRT